MSRSAGDIGPTISSANDTSKRGQELTGASISTNKCDNLLSVNTVVLLVDESPQRLHWPISRELQTCTDAKGVCTRPIVQCHCGVDSSTSKTTVFTDEGFSHLFAEVQGGEKKPPTFHFSKK